jgi:type VI protein secretion system component Hcp
MESTTQIFLRVQSSESEDDFVRGEGMVGGYADRVQIDSFDFGMKAKLQTIPRPDQKVSNNLDFDQVRVTKYFDRASMSLAGLLQNRKKLHEVRITVDQQLEEYGGEVSGKAQNAIIVFHLAEARIVDIKLDVSEDKVSATIKETVSFAFRNFSVEYYHKGMKNNKKSDYRDTYVNFQSDWKTQY